MQDWASIPSTNECYKRYPLVVDYYNKITAGTKQE